MVSRSLAFQIEDRNVILGISKALMLLVWERERQRLNVCFFIFFFASYLNHRIIYYLSFQCLCVASLYTGNRFGGLILFIHYTDEWLCYAK